MFYSFTQYLSNTDYMPGTDQGNRDTMGSRIRFGLFSHCSYGLEEETDINEIIRNNCKAVKLVQGEGDGAHHWREQEELPPEMLLWCVKSGEEHRQWKGASSEARC